MYQRILLAVDGSRSGELAVEQAITVAKATGAEIRVLFVVDDSDFPFEVSYRESTDVLTKVTTRGREILARTADRIGAAGILCVTRLLERANSPDLIADTIVSEAGKWKADLIVMGTHGRRGIRRLVMGSVSQGVVGKSTLPVLLARSDAER
uniref:universal stress protein n=1 Tax=Cupriavidus yeoncheonensis TaxID=1462994 RepID=UPI003F498802